MESSEDAFTHLSETLRSSWKTRTADWSFLRGLVSSEHGDLRVARVLIWQFLVPRAHILEDKVEAALPFMGQP